MPLLKGGHIVDASQIIKDGVTVGSVLKKSGKKYLKIAPVFAKVAGSEGWASLAARAGVCENQLRDLVTLIDLLPEGPAIRGTLTDLELARALVYDEEVFDLVDQFSLAPGPGCAPEALAVQAAAQAARMQEFTAQIYALAPGGLRLAPEYAGSPERPFLLSGSDGMAYVTPPANGNGDLMGVLPWALGAVALFLLLR